jgi:xylulokinase
MKTIGIEVKEIRSHGGGSRSDVWNQIKADITGCVVNTMANENAGCLGAAIMAGVGVGLFSNVRAACKRMIKIKKSYQPNSTNWKIYSENFRRFNTLFNSLTEMFGSEKY